MMLSNNALQLFKDIFKQTLDTILPLSSGKEDITGNDLLSKAHEVLQENKFYIDEMHISKDDLASFDQAILKWYQKLLDHMGHYGYNWSTFKESYAGTIRELLY
ncbi:hypothetical protein [Deinococcus hohokamensis]|uniref:Uncharacterized protein n=1 Tax=Deinococcus hohokamensis TaxID=309883 RepID=A0ABV9I8J1_9DEIO